MKQINTISSSVFASLLRLAVIAFAATILIVAIGADFVGNGTPGFGLSQIAMVAVASLVLCSSLIKAHGVRYAIILMVGCVAVWLLSFDYEPAKSTENGRQAAYPWIHPGDSANLPYTSEILFTIVVLPDTQVYCWKYPALLNDQIDWIVEQAQEQKIQLVLHLGDVTHHNTDHEWKIARHAFAKLDDVVPYAMAVGNHDYGINGQCETRESRFSRFFPVSHFRNFSTFGGAYDREPGQSDNCYHTFRAGGVQWLVIVLEFGPRDDVLRWANSVVSEHPEHLAILVTHAYLDHYGARYDRNAAFVQDHSPHTYDFSLHDPDVNGGQAMWEQLVSQHQNFVFTLNGHAAGDGIDLLTSKGKNGNKVHQMVVNYQRVENGGNGWLRLMQFLRDGSVRIRDYSPVLKLYNTNDAASFEVQIEQLKRANGSVKAPQPVSNTRFKSANPEIRTAIATHGFDRFDLEEREDWLQAIGFPHADMLFVNFVPSADLVKAAHDRGKRVWVRLTSTFDPGQVTKAVNSRVDGICSEDVVEMRELRR